MGKLSRLIALGLALAVVAAAQASPAVAAGVDEIKFLGADYFRGKGLVLYFAIPDDFQMGTAPGSITIGEETYGLDCHINGQGLLACLAGVKSSAIGQGAWFTFNGKQIDLSVPDVNRRCEGYAAGGYSYGIYDFDLSYVWYPIGVHVQDCPAMVGDAIQATSPDWGDTLPHYFSESGADRCAPDLGSGYYFDACWH